ncbi:sulfatase family protein [Jiulongibacter sp. NS-SX5]|uniref:sulfatase family protein n=1 Tax=Jiulongibacter sp. NS-SX5 TaxID=3463854 RepID=UPI0040583B21
MLKLLDNARALFLVFLFFTAFITQAQNKPNVILILADDMGYGDVSALNPNSKINTPNIDKLVHNGMAFTDAHSNSAVCSPTRYSILTGEYAFRTRMKSGVLVGFDPPLIEPDQLTVARIFKEADYATACIGKWHLGLGWQAKDPSKKLVTGSPWDKLNTSNVNYAAGLSSSPNDLGFDYSYIIPSSLDIAPYFYIRNKQLTTLDYENKPFWKNSAGKGAWYRNGDTGADFKHEEVLEAITAETLNFMEEKADKPFFIYMPLTAPHSPWLPSEEFSGKSGASMYGDFVTMVDAQVGKVLKKLTELEIEENTMVIFTSDNGANWEDFEKEEYNHEANYQRVGRKSDAWDGGHRVPFIVSLPGKIENGSRSDALISTVDFLATFQNLLSADTIEKHLDSQSFLPILLGQKQNGRDYLVHHSIKGHYALRKGPYKYVEAYGSGGWSLSEEDAQQKGYSFGQLYHMKNDPEEANNLYSQKQEIVSSLNAQLQRIKFIHESKL